MLYIYLPPLLTATKSHDVIINYLTSDGRMDGRTSYRVRQRLESSMMPGPGQYNLRDFSEYGGGAYSHPLF